MSLRSNIAALVLAATSLATNADAAGLSSALSVQPSTTMPSISPTSVQTLLTQWTGRTGTVYPAMTELSPAQRQVEMTGVLANGGSSALYGRRPAAKRLRNPLPAALNGFGYPKFGPRFDPTRVEANLAGCPTASTLAVQDFSKSFASADYWGDEWFGAGYSASFTVSAVGGAKLGTLDGGWGNYYAPGTLSARGDGRFDVSVLTVKKSATANAYGKLVGNTFSAAASANIAGIYTYDKTYTTNFADGEVFDPIQRTIVDAKKTFFIGPIPISLGAKATGKIGMTAGLGYFNGRLGVKANPYTNLTAQVSAALDAYVAYAGVRGNLSILELGVPMQAGLGFAAAGGQFTYGYDVNLSLAALNGNIEAYAGVDTFFYSDEWSTPLLSFSGIPLSNVRIAGAQGCTGTFLR